MKREFSEVKKEVYEHCQRIMEQRISELRRLIDGYQKASNEDTKSSAGDKYETNRAMMQLEKEKVSHSLNETLKQKQVLDQIKPENTLPKIGLGSLIETDKGLFYLAISLGQIVVADKKAFCLSPVSPLGRLFTGLNNGSEVTFNKVTYKVLAYI